MATIEKARERIETFKAVNDLYEEIYAFMERLAERKYNEHKDHASELTMLIARTALNIKDDYKRLITENKVDINLLEALINERS